MSGTSLLDVRSTPAIRHTIGAARRVAEMLIDGARRSTMEELTDHTLTAEKILVF